jgi:urease accessory protein
MQRLDPWHGRCELRFEHRQSEHGNAGTVHQGGCSAPFKLLRAEQGNNGRCELPILHTAGGLVGGDQLSIALDLKTNSRCLITSVAAQKVYGSIGRSRLYPEGQWARQQVHCTLAKSSDLEWLPQELVLYANALYEQQLTVQLPADASFLSAEIVRLGRTAAGETLQQGRWRSALSICRRSDEPHQANRWEMVDRLDLGGDALNDQHGLNKQPVFGSLVWAAPMPLSGDALAQLLELVRSDREGLEGTLRCSALDQGLVARYAGPSSRDARFWFSRIWARTRALRALSAPQIPRVWPLQEQPLPPSSFITNTAWPAIRTH